MPIKVTDISLNYSSDVIFRDFSFLFEKNKIYSLVGESGIGKTSLINVISKITKIDIGRIDIEGNLSYLFQDPILLEHLTLLENSMLSQKLQQRKLSKSENIQLLKDFGLKEDDLKKLPISSSGGMKQRVALAQTLLPKNENILLDEPFKGIDYTNINNILEISWDFIKNIESTVICVTHNIEQALLFSDEILVFLDRKRIESIKLHKDYISLSPSQRKGSTYFDNYLVEIIKIKARNYA